MPAGKPSPIDATFFATPAAFRKWLERNHAQQSELWVGFHKKGSGKPSMTWPESVEQALCFGWIDGVRKSLDGDRYVIRFTPRRRGSIWSAKNLGTMKRLLDGGLVHPAGRAAYDARDPERTNRYSFEREHAALDASQERAFRKNARAWAFFQQQPPSYRKMTTHWVTSAKKPETRAKRLAELIADSAAGLRIRALRRPG